MNSNASLQNKPNSEHEKMQSYGLFFEAGTENIWDTWLYYHEESFYLYYMTGPVGGWDGIAMATSRDGIRWERLGKILERSEGMTTMGAGSTWSIGEDSNNKKFIMNFSQASASLQTTILFAESRDLIHWDRLDSTHPFPPDERWYRPIGRWENIWTLPRPGGGFYGYWAATLKEERAGLGFGESLDGITWKSLPPLAIQELIEPPEIEALIKEKPENAILYRSPEIGAIHSWNGKHYALLGLRDLEPMLDIDFQFHPGVTTFVGDSFFGPFSPAPKNRQLLVGDGAYFCRFVTTPDGLLVNHHSWETDPNQLLGVDQNRIYMAPLKRAAWDDEGTLRLMWWNGYDKAKNKRLFVEFTELAPNKARLLLNTSSDSEKTLILEGKIFFHDPKNTAPIGLYFQGASDTDTAFLVHKSGVVEYGSLSAEDSHFRKDGKVDREISLQGPVHFRLIKKGRLTELYINDFLMHCYCLPENNLEHIGLIGPLNSFDEIAAWYV